MIRWEYVPDKGWRCYVAGHRLHHGMTGLILVGAGIALCLHDRRDFPYTSH